MKAAVFLLFRTATILGLAYAWLFKSIAGAGNVMTAYVFLFAVVGIVAACGTVDPVKALKIKMTGKFLRWIEVSIQLVMLGLFVWFGHFGLAFFWSILCVAITVARNKVLGFQEKAKKMGFTADDVDALTELMEGFANGKKYERKAAAGKSFQGVGMNAPGFNQ